MARTTGADRRIDGAAATGNYHTHALTRGLLILEVLARGDGAMTLTQLHEVSGLPKSTLVRLLSALTEEQFLVRVDDRPAYRLGHKVADLARAYLGGLDVSQSAKGYLGELAETTRHTSNLGVLDGGEVLHVAVESPNRPLRFESRVGDRAMTYCTGLGKMLLSGLSDAEVSAVLPARLERLTPSTITTRAALLRGLAVIREQGFSSDDNEHSEGLRCLAVPLVVDGRMVAAVSVSGPSGEFDAASQGVYLRHLRHAATLLAADPEVVDALGNVPTHATDDS